MIGETEFNVGQEIALTLDGGKQVTITVTEIDVRNRDIVFTIAGDGVERPNEPRRMNVFALSKWITAVKAKGA